MSLDGDVVAFGSPFKDVNSTVADANDGIVKVFRLTGGTSDPYARGVGALDAAATSALWDDPWSGSWTQLGGDIVGADVADFIGTTFSLSNDGTRLAEWFSNSATLRAFEYDPTLDSWVQLGKAIEWFTATDGMHAGGSVAMSGDGRVVVGGLTIDPPDADAYGFMRVHQLADTCCGVDERVSGFACEPCDVGYSRLPGDDWAGADTTCDACAMNYHVFDNACVACEEGLVNARGDPISGPDTTCRCPEDHRVVDNACVPCVSGSKKPAGDDPSGEDTYCASHCEKSRSWKVLGPDVEGSDEYASSGVATSLSEDGSILAIGSSRASDDAEPGYVRVYRRTTVDEDSCLALGCVTEGVGARDEWIQLGDEVVGEGAGDAFGGAVQLSSDGSRLVVGAAGNDGDGTVSDAGHARVFAYDETNAAWTQLGGDLVGDEPGERAGAAVAISGDGARVAVGATYANNSGRVRVYEYVAADDAWNQIGEDIAGSSPNSTLGASVALSRNGSVVAVGIPLEAWSHMWNEAPPLEKSGVVRVYDWSNRTEDETFAWVWRSDPDGLLGWAPNSPLGIPETGYENAGTSVSLSADGSIVAVGAPYAAEGAGSVQMYSWQVSFFPARVWMAMGDAILGEAAHDHSGSAVSLSSNGRRVAIGARYNDGADVSTAPTRRRGRRLTTLDTPETLGANVGHVRVYEWIHPTSPRELAFREDMREEWDHYVLVHYDSNGDGVIDAYEFNNGTIDWPVPFEDADADADGVISAEEYVDAMWEKYGPSGPEGPYDDYSEYYTRRRSLLAHYDADYYEYAQDVTGFTTVGYWAQVGEDMDAFQGAWRFGQSVAISGDGRRVVGGTPHYPNYEPDYDGPNNGFARVYEISDDCCGANERVDGGVCVKCDVGYSRRPGDDWAGADTTCDACAMNYHAFNNSCVACAPGAVNPAGDPVAGDDTACVCPADFRGAGGECEACPNGAKKARGDDPFADRSFCDCDISGIFPPAHGAAGTCGNATTLAVGDACQPTCGTGYVADGDVACTGDPFDGYSSTVTSATRCLCAKDFRVVLVGPNATRGECRACPAGSLNAAGDDPSNGEETHCDCDASAPPLHGAVGTCVDPLTPGTSCQPTCEGPAYAPNATTTCSPRGELTSAYCGCARGYRVERHVCVPCAYKYDNPPGDDPRGEDTTCAPIPACDSEERVLWEPVGPEAIDFDAAPVEWTQCAVQGDACDCDGPGVVRYGTGDKWAYYDVPAAEGDPDGPVQEEPVVDGVWIEAPHTKGAEWFDATFQASEHHIIRVDLNGNQWLYYKRLRDKTTFKPYYYIFNNWFAYKNEQYLDFELYTTYENALAGKEGQVGNCNFDYAAECAGPEGCWCWGCTGYDDPGTGFPRDCMGLGGNQWISRMTNDNAACNVVMNGYLPCNTNRFDSNTWRTHTVYLHIPKKLTCEHNTEYFAQDPAPGEAKICECAPKSSGTPWPPRASTAISSDGNAIAIGHARGYNSASVYRFSPGSGAWTKLGDDVAGANPNDAHGRVVSLSSAATTLVVGAPSADATALPAGNRAGAVRAYAFSNGGWTPHGNVLFGAAADDGFGASVVVSDDGNRIVVGDANGRVYAYKYSYGIWIKMGTNPYAQEWAPAGVDGGLPGAIEHGFEPALSGDGNVLAYKSRDDGAVYIWRYYEYYDAWYPLGNISRGPGDTSSGRFGYSLAFRRTGDRIAIGAPCAEDPCAAAGKVYVYYQSGGPSWGTTWVEWGAEPIAAPDLAATDFGTSVSMSDDGSRIAIATGLDVAHARVYALTSDYWTPVGNNSINGTVVGTRWDPAPRVTFARGARVAISGDGGSVVAAAFVRPENASLPTDKVNPWIPRAVVREYADGRGCCGNDQRVEDHKCVPCQAPFGTTRPPGDDPFWGPDTVCGVLCGWNERVEDEACVACPYGTKNYRDDYSLGGDTTCDLPPAPAHETRPAPGTGQLPYCDGNGPAARLGFDVDCAPPGAMLSTGGGGGANGADADANGTTTNGATAIAGATFDHPAPSCRAIYDAFPPAPDGPYWFRDAVTGALARRYCLFGDASREGAALDGEACSVDHWIPNPPADGAPENVGYCARASDITPTTAYMYGAALPGGHWAPREDIHLYGVYGDDAEAHWVVAYRDPTYCKMAKVVVTRDAIAKTCSVRVNVDSGYFTTPPSEGRCVSTADVIANWDARTSYGYSVSAIRYDKACARATCEAGVVMKTGGATTLPLGKCRRLGDINITGTYTIGGAIGHKRTGNVHVASVNETAVEYVFGYQSTDNWCKMIRFSISKTPALPHIPGECAWNAIDAGYVRSYNTADSICVATEDVLNNWNNRNPFPYATSASVVGYGLQEFTLDKSCAAAPLRERTKCADAYAESGGTWTQVGSDIDGEAEYDFSGYSVSMSSDGTRVAIGARLNDGAGDSAGHVRVYSESGGTWTQVGSDIDGEAAGDLSGWSISMSSDGTRVAIGATGNDGAGTTAGHVRVYAESGGTWTQVGADIDGEAAMDSSAYAVSMSSDGTRVAIGAPGNDVAGNNDGHVRVYAESGGTWTQVGADIDGEAELDHSGHSVSMSSDGTRVAIGAYGNDGGGTGLNAGHVRVYAESGGTWTQVGSDIDGEAATDSSGAS
jgi:hypothetical protein